MLRLHNLSYSTPLTTSGLKLWQGSKFASVLLFPGLFDCQYAALYQQLTSRSRRWYAFCGLVSPYNSFDPLIGHSPIWLHYSANQTTSIRGPPNNDKTQSSHTSNLKLHFLISGLSGEKHGNAIHTQTGNNQKARYKVCCKLVRTLSSVVHLHIFFEHC